MSKAQNLLLKLGVKSTESKVDIYRDGEIVTVVARGNAVRENEGGKVRTSGMVMQQYENIDAFEADRKKLFDRFPLAYTRIMGKLGISDDINKAKPLPESMRHLLPEYMKALPKNTESDVEISVEGEISTPWYEEYIK